MRAPRRLVGALAGIAVIAAAAARAERLPVTSWTVADGLPRDAVLSLFVDSRGGTWIATSEGLARAEGNAISVRVGEGLPDARVHEIAETPDGLLWIATQGGLYRLRPEGRLPDASATPAAASAPWRRLGTLDRREPRWTACAAPDGSRAMTAVLASGLEVFAGTPRGVLRVEDAGGSPRLVREPLGAVDDEHVQALAAAEPGALWIGTRTALFHASASRTIRRIAFGSGSGNGSDDGSGSDDDGGGGGASIGDGDGDPGADVRDIESDGDGGAWVATSAGLWKVDAPARGGSVRGPITEADGLPSRDVRAVLRGGDGTLMVATLRGIAERPPGESEFRGHGASEGLTSELTLCLAEDRAGNTWIGSEVSGLFRLSRTGMTSFGREDGLFHPRIASLIEDADGRLIAVDGTGAVNVLRGRRFEAIVPRVLTPEATAPWGWNQVAFQDSRRSWWVPTRHGAARWDRVASPEELATRPPDALVAAGDDARGDEVFRMHELASGDVLLSTFTPSGRTLWRWSHEDGKVTEVPLPEGMEPAAATLLLEAPDGSLWAGFYHGSVARLRGREWFFVRTDEEADGDQARGGAFDSAGRLWIAGESFGLLRIDEPGASVPAVSTSWRAADGLASDDATSVTELEPGVMAIGTSRGLDLLDVGHGRIRRYGPADGLANGFVNVLRRDREGTLWLGTLDGVARLRPPGRRVLPPPAVRLADVRVDGVALPMSLAGETAIAGLLLPPGGHQLEVRATGLTVAAGEALRFAHSLDGAPWSDPREDESLTLASLSSGKHVLKVAAVAEDGRSSTSPATLELVVARPAWQRPWFLALAIAVASAGGALAHRARVARLIELERVRTRIATDLHDDVGTSLTQVAILSEVARRRADDGGDASEPLRRIGEVTRELVDSMSDIVWAIDPRRDTLGDLVHRMRRLAEDLTEDRGVRFELDVSGDERLLLFADVRRQAHLVFKEALHNAVRHSSCTRIRVALHAQGPLLRLRIEDDGAGFDAASVALGHGLTSMRRRAEEMGGELGVDSEPGRGTVIRLVMPLRPKGRRIPT